MQQTNKYKLNLIEKTDTFSPDPLNENMEKLEAQLIQADGALAAETNARAAAVTAEANARAAADSAETAARTAAVNAEANARTDAVTAEANARAAAVTAEANTRAAADTALGARITPLESRRIVVGHYTGNSSTNGVFQNINLGFQPQLVLIRTAATGVMAVTAEVALPNTVLITTTGFKVCDNSTMGKWNTLNTKYLYLAIL